MKPETREILEELYGDFNQQLAVLLNNRKFTWKWQPGHRFFLFLFIYLFILFFLKGLFTHSRFFGYGAATIRHDL